MCNLGVFRDADGAEGGVSRSKRYAALGTPADFEFHPFVLFTSGLHVAECCCDPLGWS